MLAVKIFSKWFFKVLFFLLLLLRKRLPILSSFMLNSKQSYADILGFFLKRRYSSRSHWKKGDKIANKFTEIFQTDLDVPCREENGN